MAQDGGIIARSVGERGQGVPLNEEPCALLAINCMRKKLTFFYHEVDRVLIDVGTLRNVIWVFNELRALKKGTARLGNDCHPIFNLPINAATAVLAAARPSGFYWKQ